MIKLTQPGGAGEVAHKGRIEVGTLCYLSSEDIVSWRWRFKPPKGSNSALSSLTGFHPTFPPDVPGVYEITFIDHDGKEYNLTVTGA